MMALRLTQYQADLYASSVIAQSELRARAQNMASRVYTAVEIIAPGGQVLETVQIPEAKERHHPDDASLLIRAIAFVLAKVENFYTARQKRLTGN